LAWSSGALFFREKKNKGGGTEKNIWRTSLMS
jgi:hypothetical protein